MKYKSIIALILCIASFLGLMACTSEAPTAETTEIEIVTTKPETKIEETTEMEEIKENVSLDGKRVIFIGNSYVYYGRTVINQSTSVMTQAERENDKGFFYQLCKENGYEINDGR